MCQPPIVIFSVKWVHENLVAHGHNPPYSSRQPKCGWLVVFVIITITHPTHYYLEYSGSAMNMETHPKLCRSDYLVMWSK